MVKNGLVRPVSLYLQGIVAAFHDKSMESLWAELRVPGTHGNNCRSFFFVCTFLNVFKSRKVCRIIRESIPFFPPPVLQLIKLTVGRRFALFCLFEGG